MFRRLRAAFLILCVGIALGLNAQTYQSSFGPQEFDRIKHAISNPPFRVEQLSGAGLLDLPIGPGIGNQDIRFAPTLRMRASAQVTGHNSCANAEHWLVDSGDPSATLLPGHLNIYRHVPPLSRVMDYLLPDGERSSISLTNTTKPSQLASVDVAKILSLYGYPAGTGLGYYPYGKPSERVTFLQATTSGDLVIGINHASLFPEVSFSTYFFRSRGDFNTEFASASDPLYVPGRVLILHKMTIYEYAPQTTLKVTPGLNTSYTSLVYTLSSIRNRFNESIDFTYSASGVGYSASFSRGGTAVGSSINVGYEVRNQFDPNRQAPDHIGISIVYSGSVNSPRFNLDTKLNGKGSIYDAIHAIAANTYDRNYGFIDGEDHLGSITPLQLTDLLTQESVSFVYTTGTLSNWGQMTCHPVHLSALNFSSGKSIQLSWQEFPYRSNYSWITDWGGYSGNYELVTYQGAGSCLSSNAQWFYGINALTESDSVSGTSRTTYYQRGLPDPDLDTPNNFRSTRNFEIITHSDGLVEVHRYAEPLNGVAGGPGESDAAQLATLAHLKGVIKESRFYKPGDDVTSDMSQSPGNSVAYRVIAYDNLDLKATGSPFADYAHSMPMPLRVRSWDKLSNRFTVQEKVDWNPATLTWNGALSKVYALSQVDPVGNVSADPLFQTSEKNTFQSDYSTWDLGFLNQSNAFLEKNTLGSFYDPSAGALPIYLSRKELEYNDNKTIKRTSIGNASGTLSKFNSFKSTTGLEANKLESISPISSVTPLAGSGVMGGSFHTYGINSLPKENYTSYPLPTAQVNKYFLGQVESDSLGLIQSQTDLNGLKSLLFYNAKGLLSEVRPPNNEKPNFYTYDDDQRGLKVQRGDQQLTRRVNSFGEEVRRYRLSGPSTYSHQKIGYDSAGRKVWETIWLPGMGSDAGWDSPAAPGGSYTPAVAAWDEIAGQVCEEEALGPDGNAYCVRYRDLIIHHDAIPSQLIYGNQAFYWMYDSLGRLIKEVSPDGLVIETRYGLNANPNIRQRIVAPGTAQESVTTFESDLLGRLSRVQDALGRETQYSYSALGQISKAVQWNGPIGTLPKQERLWTYSGFGWLTSLTQPESGLTTYSDFNVLGKPQTTNYNGRIVRTTYDFMGRVLAMKSDDGTIDHTYAYDGVDANGVASASFGASRGKLHFSRQGAIAKTRTYSGLNGRMDSLTTVDWPSGTVGSGTAVTFSQQMSYDDLGQLKQRVYPDGKTQVFSYDSIKGLASSTSFGSSPAVNTPLVSMTYDPTHWGLTNLSYANGASSSFGYRQDQTSLLSMGHSIPGQLNKIWNYNYNEAGQLATDGEDWFSYDKLMRLTSVFMRDPFLTGKTNASLGVMQRFFYDPFGNRVSLDSKTITNWTAGGAAPPALPTTTTTSKAQSYTFGDVTTLSNKNQIPAYAYIETPTTGQVSTGALYDSQGNLTKIYAKMGDASTQLSLVYDALGRVTSLADAKRAATESYFFDDDGLRTKVVTGATTKYNIYNEARQLVAQYEKVGSGAATWKKSIVYVGAKEVAEVDATSTNIMLVDHLGSPRWMWSGSGAPAMQKFMPYGESFTDAATAAKFAKGFTNHEQTDASGLIYMQARFYAPWYGRFLSPDPALDQSSEATQKWNIYSYVRNNPTMSFDANGLWETPGWLKTAGSMVGGFAKGVGGGVLAMGKGAVTLQVTMLRIQFDPTYGRKLSGSAANTAHSISVSVNRAGGASNYGLAKLHSAAEAWRNADAGQRMQWTGRGSFEAAAFIAPFLPKGFGAVGKLGEAGEVTSALRFSQTTASATFSSEGAFAGSTISQVADGLRAGSLPASELPVGFIVRDGNPLIINTRSSLALKQAGIPESQWSLVNQTGNAEAEAAMTQRLLKNNLDSYGSETLRITGSGSSASTLRKD
jgi:RHS repeat-associated protein